MSEHSGRLDFLKSKLKLPQAEQKQDEESEKIAKEAVLLFANQKHQEPLATYPADSDSVFELDKQTPGTIFRIAEVSPPGYSNSGTFLYDFFVIGNINKDNANIYLISPSQVDDGMDKSVKSGNLVLSSDWKLVKLPQPKSREFKIGNSLVILFGEHDEIEISHLDVLATGKTVKQTEENKTGEAKLTPLPQVA